ncbi:MAG TPA: aminotransferase class I/II-fold pyridoxal phosphate-dependent enzyme [Vicinamibacteria bacterium]|nr:aminotransferase class I/II-fold pyridoxal phosphate-dependent enzyme [Vicinamibacteria bacterium]
MNDFRRDPEGGYVPSVHLNLNVRGLEPSATLAINELSNALIGQGREVLKLGLGQSPFPVPETVVEALKANAHQKDYLPVRGLPALREAVADYHRRKNGVARGGSNVLIGPGSKELMFLIQLVYYGDLVIPTPSWVSYAPQAQIIGRHVRWIPTSSKNNWQLQPEDLERLCEVDAERPRLMILNYPNNPTGHTYDATELKELAAVARRYRVVMLSDEIYGEIHHDGRHVSIAEFYPEGTIISTGLSKWCGAGGWRLGSFTFPEALTWLLNSMAVVASETFTATSAPIQHAAVTAFRGAPEIEAYLVKCRRILKAIGRYGTRSLKEAGARVREPAGAFYLFPDFGHLRHELKERSVTSSRVLCERLLKETGVASIPGSSCGRSESELTLRLAYVDFDGARALQALESLEPTEEPNEWFLREHCSNVTTAFDRLCEWTPKAVAAHR